MKPDIFEPFAEAASKTLKLLLDVDTLPEAVARMDEEHPELSMTDVVMDLTGDVKGEILYRFSQDTTIQIAKLMTGIEFTKIDEFVTAVLGEIARIISENAVTDLSDQDITCDILPPKIVKGKKGKKEIETSYLFTTQVRTSIGVVDVMLKLKAD